jgi:hypothetical protein
MDFRTLLPTHPAPFRIAPSDRILLVGSCFTEHIGDRLRRYKWPVCVNPYGIVYNPVSIGRCIEQLAAGVIPFVHSDLFENGGVWRSWEHHSSFAYPDVGQSFRAMLRAYEDAVSFLYQSTHVILTPGTAFVHALKSTGQIVANNHKMPANIFDGRRLTVEEATDALAGAVQAVLSVVPNIRIILTVSPVRHLRLGMAENQRSKAVLLLACEAVCRIWPERAFYFPAYELLMDDLRDYRFYAPDMVHPSDTAVDYVWQHFSDTFFSTGTKQLLSEITKIQAAATHRPFHADTPEHRAFQEKQLQKIHEITLRYPFLDFWDEISVFGGHS